MIETTSADDGTSGRCLEVQAETLDRVFADVAAALSARITDLGRVVPRELRLLELRAPDRQQLLRDWIHTVLQTFTLESMLFSRFQVTVDDSDGESTLRARLWGEPYNDQWHPAAGEPPKLDASEATLRREGPLWHARVSV